MKKKKNPIIIAVVVLIVILLAIIVMYINPFEKSSNNSEEMTTAIGSTAVSNIQTIENTLSSSGQISSALEEKVYLHTSYYFEEVLVEQNVFIEEGTNIIEYTNGTYLTAPYDCVMTSYNLPNEGEICTSSHYIQISSIESLCMTLSVSETDINKIEIGDSVDITMTASGEVLEGFITSVSEVGTYSSSGSYFTAVVTFSNSGNLKIGMSATCEIIIESAEEVIAVPLEAIQTSDDGKYVIVVNSDGTTTNTIVETGISNDAYIEIKSGISENTIVRLDESSNSSDNSSSFQRGGMSGGKFDGFSGGGGTGNMPSGMSGGMPSIP